MQTGISAIPDLGVAGKWDWCHSGRGGTFGVAGLREGRIFLKTRQCLDLSFLVAGGKMRWPSGTSLGGVNKDE